MAAQTNTDHVVGNGKWTFFSEGKGEFFYVKLRLGHGKKLVMGFLGGCGWVGRITERGGEEGFRVYDLYATKSKMLVRTYQLAYTDVYTRTHFICVLSIITTFNI